MLISFTDWIRRLFTFDITVEGQREVLNTRPNINDLMSFNNPKMHRFTTVNVLNGAVGNTDYLQCIPGKAFIIHTASSDTAGAGWAWVEIVTDNHTVKGYPNVFVSRHYTVSMYTLSQTPTILRPGESIRISFFNNSGGALNFQWNLRYYEVLI